MCRSHQDRAEEDEKQLRQSVGLLTKLYGAEHKETAEGTVCKHTSQPPVYM